MEWFKKLDSLFFITGRSLLGLYFIAPGLSKVFDFSSTLALMQMKGVPFSSVLLPITIIIQLIGCFHDSLELPPMPKSIEIAGA